MVSDLKERSRAGLVHAEGRGKRDLVSRSSYSKKRGSRPLLSGKRQSPSGVKEYSQQQQLGGGSLVVLDLQAVISKRERYKETISSG